MNLGFFIARKYFLSKKKKNFINVISIISMAVVAFGTMSLIIALSVFNGLEGLLRSLYGNFDPDIIIKVSEGKSFKVEDDFLVKLKNEEGIAAVIEVIEDNVLVQYKEAQRLVRMKGVSENFLTSSEIESAMVAGEFKFAEEEVNYALIGRGVQYDLSINLKNEFYTLQVYYPKNIAPGVVNPEKLYTLKNIVPGGIFAIEKFYDENYVFVPLKFASDLLNYGNKRTAIELELEDGVSVERIKQNLSKRLGEGYTVISGEELHSDLYKILKIEKLFVFIVFALIIGIASINIYFSLTMLVIEKKKDIAVLVAQGASSTLIKRIFLYEGCIVAFSGSLLGLLLGLGFCYAQMTFGLIGMGMDTAVIQSYPVEIEWMDILATIFVVILITVLVSIQPALKAGKSFILTSLQ